MTANLAVLIPLDIDAQIHYLEENFSSIEDRINGLKIFFATLVENEDFSLTLSFTEKMLKARIEWLDILRKLQIVELNILHCSEEVYLFELIGIIREFLNESFRNSSINKEVATQIVKILKLMAEIFLKFELYQASIDLYRDSISISTSFKVNPTMQASIIYDSLCLHESQERYFDAFELAYLGHQTVEHLEEKAWPHLFERTIESIAHEIIPTYVKSAYALLWKGDSHEAKNFIISALRCVGILLKIRGTTNSNIRSYIDQIRTIMTMQRLVGQEETEIIEILGKLLINSFNPKKVRGIGNGLISYCNLAFRPSINVLMVIDHGLMIYSKSVAPSGNLETNSIYNEQGQLLLSALVSAVSTSMGETLGKNQQIKQIEYGSQIVMIEREDDLDLLLLVDRETSELRARMVKFLQDALNKGFREKFNKGLHLTEDFEEFFDPIVHENFGEFFLV